MRKVSGFKQHDLFKNASNSSVKLSERARSEILSLLCNLLCELRETSARITENKGEETCNE
jgi:hypothetical protein